MKRLIISLLFLLFNVVFSQELNVDAVWTETFGNATVDEGNAVQQTTDGGFIIVGLTRPYEGDNMPRLWLIKTDSVGTEEWTYFYDESGSSVGYSVQQTNDGGYIAVGTFSNAILLVKVDFQGNEEWNQSLTGGGGRYGYSVQQTNDSGYIITGETHNISLILLKTDSQGNQEWYQTFGTNNDFEMGYDVQKTSDGGYIIVGEAQFNGSNNKQVWLIKTDSVGTEEWSQDFGGDAYEIGYSLQQTTDGGYIITGVTSSFGNGGYDVWLLKTDMVGDTLWTKLFGGSNDEIGYSVQQTTDGGYIISGSTESFGNGERDVWLIKTDTTGNEEWNQTFGGSDNDIGNYVRQTSDGAYIITGNTRSFGNGDWDVWLLKVVANHSPTSFALNEQDSVYITMASFDSDSIVFGWDESADVDGDELTYHFTAELIINNQLTTEYDTTLTANVMKIDYQSVFDEIYAAQAMLAGIEWDVSVSDGIEEVMAENGPLTVGINASDAVLTISEELLPKTFALHQNYPNPFNPITTLRYDLPENSYVNVTIYDMLGRQVKSLINQTQDAGFKSIIWDATNDFGKPVSAGVYLYKIQAGDFIHTKKMVLLK